jgi:hypothetical protein
MVQPLQRKQVLISAMTELRMIQAWGLHFATKFCVAKSCAYQNRMLDWQEPTLFQNVPLNARLGAALENFLSKKSFQTVFFVSAML